MQIDFAVDMNSQGNLSVDRTFFCIIVGNALLSRKQAKGDIMFYSASIDMTTKHSYCSVMVIILDSERSPSSNNFTCVSVEHFYLSFSSEFDVITHSL